MNYALTIALLVASSSAMRLNNRWVELPNCKVGTLGPDEVPLADDLSNAIIATCKAYNPRATIPEPAEPTPTAVQEYQQQWGKNYSYWQPAQIFDPVMYTH